MSHLEFPDAHPSLLPILPRTLHLPGDSSDPRFLCLVHDLLDNPLILPNSFLEIVVWACRNLQQALLLAVTKGIRVLMASKNQSGCLFLARPKHSSANSTMHLFSLPSCPQTGHPHNVGAGGEAGTGSVEIPPCNPCCSGCALPGEYGYHPSSSWGAVVGPSPSPCGGLTNNKHLILQTLTSRHSLLCSFLISTKSIMCDCLVAGCFQVARCTCGFSNHACVHDGKATHCTKLQEPLPSLIVAPHPMSPSHLPPHITFSLSLPHPCIQVP